MNSRERILASFSHKQPDRIPFDLGGTHVTAIALHAYQKLREALELPAVSPVFADMVQQVVVPDEDFLEYFKVDTRGLFPLCSHNIPLPMYSERWHKYHKPVGDDAWDYLDEWNFVQHFQKDSLYYSLKTHPLEGMDVSVEQVKKLKMPDGGEAWRFEGLAKKAKTYRSLNKIVAVKSICAGMFEMGQRVRGMENFFCDLMINQPAAECLMDRILEIKMNYWTTAFEQLGDLVDVVIEPDDYGAQVALLIPPDIFRQLIKPRLAQLVSHIKKLSPNIKFFLHSCGAIRPIMPDLIEIGVDILNPIHANAAGMAPEGLKKDFGKDIVFWGGGVETQNILPRGTVEQVRDDVKRNIDALAKDGGWIFATVHNIQADCSPENIIAMWETLQAYA